MSCHVMKFLDRSLGHASWNRKVSKKHRVTDDPVRMPPIVDFTTETAKDREWDNIAAIHRCFDLANFNHSLCVVFFVSA